MNYIYALTTLMRSLAMQMMKSDNISRSCISSNTRCDTWASSGSLCSHWSTMPVVQYRMDPSLRGNTLERSDLYHLKYSTFLYSRWAIWKERYQLTIFKEKKWKQLKSLMTISISSKNVLKTKSYMMILFWLWQWYIYCVPYNLALLCPAA